MNDSLYMCCVFACLLSGDGNNRNAMAVLWCSRVQWGLESWRLEVGAPGGFSGPGGGVVEELWANLSRLGPVDGKIMAATKGF